VAHHRTHNHTCKAATQPCTRGQQM
jgi:hypothetical protein